MSTLQTLIPTDTWVRATWEEYLRALEDPAYAKAKGYYHHQHMRLEMMPVGFDHSTDHALIALAINLFGIMSDLPLTLCDNCSYRKTGQREAQPDLSCYVGENVKAVPKSTNIVSLDRYPAPDLAIEIAKTSLLDDLGNKRSLYEALGVSEYWVVDVEQMAIAAYATSETGSHQIGQSEVLAGLGIELLEAALHRSRETDQSAVGAWLMGQYQEMRGKC